MKKINEMKLEFISNSVNESFARMAVAAFASQLDPTVEEITDIKTAVSEAVTNAIVHGYPDSVGEITLTAILDDGRLHIEIKDDGVGIENVDEAQEPFFTTKPENERSGMGFTVMKSFMSEVYVKSSLNKGTLVTLVKYLKNA